VDTDLAQALDRLPRVSLANLPTPLQEARRLRDALGGPGRCPRILLKRDDLTGLASGGNKARKLEFIVADALNAQATVLVTTGGVQSNHARMTAAAGRMVGLGASLVLTGALDERDVQGNLLLDRLFGAEVHFIEAGSDPRLVAGPDEAATLARVAADLRGRGERPYMIPLGGSCPLGALGYVVGTLELLSQLEASAERPSRLYVACGSRGTAAGLVLGARLSDAPYGVHGVAVSGGDPAKTEHAAEIATEAAGLLGRPVRLTAADFATDQSQIGAGYGRSTPGCLEAIDLLARTEGILLDPVYTGKAMAGLIADIRSRSIRPSETVVFLHTGGLPGLFAHAAELAHPVRRADPPTPPS
jgi:D-cysteine desulfhydrase family pyridoxal phosphate-dependent enzyme